LQAIKLFKVELSGSILFVSDSCSEVKHFFVNSAQIIN